MADKLREIAVSRPRRESAALDKANRLLMLQQATGGFQSAHEVIADDWIALHINEIEGGVISNNKTANGAFCVLHVGGAKDNEVGAVEFHQHDPNGLFTHYFDNHQSTIRNMNLKLLDRKGDPAHFGRIHLWFKICVEHG